MTPPPAKIVVDAIKFATQRHVHQVRKDGRTPYVSHPFRVMFHLTQAGVTDADTLAAAVLHDTIEDTSADFDDLKKRFGTKVALYVSLLSKDKRQPEEEREDNYFAMLEKAPAAVKLCKLGDTYDNLIDAISMPSELGNKAADKAERLLGIFRGKIPKEQEFMVQWIEDAVDALRETKAIPELDAVPVKIETKNETRKRKKSQ